MAAALAAAAAPAAAALKGAAARTVVTLSARVPDGKGGFTPCEPPVQCNRILYGLWQTSGGWGEIDATAAVAAMRKLIERDALTTFDAADHYGPAEDLLGAVAVSRGGYAGVTAFTKWVPAAKALSRDDVTAAVARSLRRMRTGSLDLLQFHWWDYAKRDEMLTALRYLNEERVAGRIKQLALTNFDTTHVAFLVDECGLPIAANQVQFSVVDTRPLERMAPYCAGRGIGLLAYGTLMGGLISERWLGKAEPRTREDVPTPSLGKYYRMVRSWGDWRLFQELLATLQRIAAAKEAAATATTASAPAGGSTTPRPRITLSTIALRWVLDQPAVAGVIVGLRAGLSDHSAENALALSPLAALTADDVAAIAAVQARGARLMDVIGDCGDEYRR